MKASVVLVRFPFTSLETAKKRPALLLRETRLTDKVRLATVAMVTSQVDGIKITGDCPLEDWSECGLLHPSLVRLAKIATIDWELVERSLGNLTSKDFGAVRKMFRSVFRDWA